MHKSDQPALSHRRDVLGSDHDMIEQAYLNEQQCLRQLHRDRAICFARLSHTARMVVRQDQRRRIVGERTLHHLSGIYGGAVDGASEQLFVPDQPMARVQEQAAEHFVVTVR
jgi:hypothetical protein